MLDIEPVSLAAMQAINREHGGMLAVNEQVRRAVRRYLESKEKMDDWCI